MKKIISSILVLVLLSQMVIFAEVKASSEGETYQVPAYLRHFYEEGPSMGNNAIRHYAKAVVNNGKVTYTLYTSKMTFAKVEGRVTNMFVFKDDENSKKVEAKKISVDINEYNTIKNKKVPFDEAFVFSRDKLKEPEIIVSVWVDVMDKLASEKKDGSYTPGAGEKKARLQLDWSKAEKLEKEQPKETKKETPIVKVKAIFSTQNMTLDGKALSGLEVYNIAGHNYFKLRDIAKLADATDSKFSVAWNGKKGLISLVKGESYTPNGSELTGGDGTNKQGVTSTAKVEVDGKLVELEAYNIKGNNYYQIRHLGKALDFGVAWNGKTSTVELTMNK